MSYQSAYTGAEIEAILDKVDGMTAYFALLNQSGTDAPVATVLRNDFSAAPVWTRASAGSFEGTLEGEFPAGKTMCLQLQNKLIALIDMATVIGDWQFYRASDDAVGLLAYSDAFTTPADDMIENLPVIILVFP